MIIKMSSYAKVNLGLRIFDKKDDNLHELETLIQSIDVCDNIEVSNIETFGINLVCDKEICSYDRNTAFIAAKKFLEYVNIESGINIKLKKNIPMGAGLGGGSSNAAAVIFALNKIFNSNLKKEELIKIALMAGSDVPLCLIGGTIIAKGVGEKIEKIKKIKDCIFLIVKPDYCVNTKKAFDLYDVQKKQSFSYLSDSMKDKKFKNLVNLIKSEGEIEEIFKNTFNDFEDIVSCAKVGFRLTGSGSAFYKMFGTKSEADYQLEKFKKEKICAFLAKPVNYGVKEVEDFRN